MSRVNPQDLKTSLLINRQVPEFIREDHPLFISFLEAYYEFLETEWSPPVWWSPWCVSLPCIKEANLPAPMSNKHAHKKPANILLNAKGSLIKKISFI